MASATSSTAYGLNCSGVGQLQCRAGELAQEQDAVFIESTGHEFLGDQVHPVVERADDAEVGQPVEGHHLDLVEISLVVHHRLPFRRPHRQLIFSTS